jgi:lysophospholipase L1-like esterase
MGRCCAMKFSLLFKNGKENNRSFIKNIMKHKTVLMIGDSITEGFGADKYLSGNSIVNKGVSGDSTVECLERINGKWFSEEPSIVFVCIGTNDLARERTDHYIIGNIQKIVEKIRTYTVSSLIYLTTIFPTRNNEPRPNARIIGFNEQLKSFAAEHQCGFFDLHKYFTDDQGMLKKEFTDDGLHLTESAYKVWRDVLSEFLHTEPSNPKDII